jgi:hypothetical protein
MSVRLAKRQLRREIQQTLKKLTNSEIIEECIFYLDKSDLSSESLRKNSIPTSSIQYEWKCFDLSFHALRRTSNEFDGRKSI